MTNFGKLEEIDTDTNSENRLDIGVGKAFSNGSFKLVGDVFQVGGECPKLDLDEMEQNISE